MKLITYSDLHLEFGTGFRLPLDSEADLLILAGDIITFHDFARLNLLLEGWKKPVLFVAGNHEYYNGEPMKEGEARFKQWLAEYHPNVVLLRDEAIDIHGVYFFGGTMWTDFNNGDTEAMDIASRQMNDYRQILTSSHAALKPTDTIIFHEAFVEKLLAWFEEEVSGERVVISHHAPVVNPHTQYGSSPLMPAFNSLDMQEIIEKHQPRLWVYGHTHECDNQTIGRTQIISNQLGYPQRSGGFECRGFDKTGLPMEV